jgi:hypothetical protein
MRRNAEGLCPSPRPVTCHCEPFSESRVPPEGHAPSWPCQPPWSPILGGRRRRIGGHPQTLGSVPLHLLHTSSFIVWTLESCPSARPDVWDTHGSPRPRWERIEKRVRSAPGREDRFVSPRWNAYPVNGAAGEAVARRPSIAGGQHGFEP